MWVGYHCKRPTLHRDIANNTVLATPTGCVIFLLYIFSSGVISTLLFSNVACRNAAIWKPSCDILLAVACEKHLPAVSTCWGLFNHWPHYQRKAFFVILFASTKAEKRATSCFLQRAAVSLIPCKRVNAIADVCKDDVTRGRLAFRTILSLQQMWESKMVPIVHAPESDIVTLTGE